MTTEVFLLTTGTGYEEENPRGVYSSMSKALEAGNKITDEDTVSIYLMQTDKDYGYDPPCLWYKNARTGEVMVGKCFEATEE